MEALLREPLDMAPTLESISQLCEPVDMARTSSEDFDPFLDYINHILMENGMDDATQVDNASYQAIFTGFYNILGEHLRPNYEPHVEHQSMHFYLEKGPDEQHVKVVNPNSMTYEPRISLPANGHLHSSFQQERAEVGLHDSSLQGHVMASHTPLKSTPITDMYNLGSHLNSTVLNEASASSSSKINTNVRLNNGVLMDVMVPCWGKDAVVEGVTGHGCVGWLEQRYGNFKPPSGDEGFSLKLAEVDLSFEDLTLNAVYTDLYVGEPSSLGSSTRAACDTKHTGNKKTYLAVAGNGSKSGKKSTSEVHTFVDVREFLVSCAQAVAIGDARRANEHLQELRRVYGASANGSGLQRTEHFFSEALAARLRGMGEQHLKAISHNMPSAATLMRASKLGFEVTPFMKVVHYFANQSILKEAERASRLHVLDYGFLYGMQWPFLIHALADRKGGPPSLVITGIEFPQPGTNMAERLYRPITSKNFIDDICDMVIMAAVVRESSLLFAGIMPWPL